MEPIHYFVTKIEGDYAILVPESCPQPVELPVALALLPDGLGVGNPLRYENWVSTGGVP